MRARSTCALTPTRLTCVASKTGITLPDHGLRDEHGFEPMSGIFDSPVKSPAQHPSSDDMHIQHSSAPGVEHTMLARNKTPKLGPPARASTPKHTHLGGSPKRMSMSATKQHQPQHPQTTAGRAKRVFAVEDATSPVNSRTQPRPANRKLDFSVGEEGVVKSVEAASPFKPRHALRRSLDVRQDPFASPLRPQVRSGSVVEAMEAVEASVQFLSGDDEVPMADEADAPMPQDEQSFEGQAEEGPATTVFEEPTMRPTSSSSAATVSTITRPSSAKSSRKRHHSVFDEGPTEATTSRRRSSGADQASANKKRRSIESSVNLDYDTAVIDPVLLDDTGLVIIDDEEPSVAEVAPPAPSPPKKTKAKRKAKPTKAALQERSANVSSRASAPPDRREGSLAPTSNFSLRATTPFDDAIGTTRSGRNVIKPLQYWANETRIYRHGECEGIIRAEEVEKKKSGKKRRNGNLAQRVKRLEGILEEGADSAPVKTTGHKGRKSRARSTPIADDYEDVHGYDSDDAASTAPDEWESSLGVISGTIASWNPQTQSGDPSDPVREDLAFAASSIVTREVPGSDFRYAKIMTLPFFGAGVVELPPEGYKRSKNSRKMAMVFFV